ncbi:MAG: T9SS type A sorting domain-containing protein [Candidatus Latescibacteria bacterium]|nr:T9SS type A sorting domain-containing protein [bacterium]MBD3424122.1 T9SS type A sorting domain-containing protein [Candidatus Latescibacterota bacterium]
MERGMKKTKWFLILLVVQLMVAHSALAQGYPIKVALYSDDGTGDSRFDVEAALSDTTLFNVTHVLGADIRAGILQNFDIVIHPGGSGSGQAESLQESGRDSVRAFINRGGGYLGICAGSYLASSDYTWSLNILNTKVIDKAHWARGTGPVDVRFNNFGKEMFGFSADTVVIDYYQGALMAPSDNSAIPPYIEAGIFASEIAENGAPSGVMIGTCAFAFGVYGEGRAVAFSPHPELTSGREYMVADAVQWATSSDPFLGLATPRELQTWESGSTRTIEWLSESGIEPVDIEFSSDNGATWSLVASAQTAPYDWLVPDVDSDECMLRIESVNQSTLTDSIYFAITPPPPSIISARGGDWHDPSTWVGEVVPTATDNVIIGSGHTVFVDSVASCLDISFEDDTGRLGLEDDIYIYGDFYRYNTSVNPFYSGGNLWDAGVDMIFTGDAEIQTIHNLGTTSTSPYPLRIRNLVVDKSAGKFTTNPIEGTAGLYRLGIGDKLEVINGEFELGLRDDIEGRTTWGSATTPEIIVHENGVFRMLGEYSHIRRGNFIGDDSSKIGKMTIFGEAYLANYSSNRINIGDIDIEDGGLLRIPWYSEGGSMGTSDFNPGTITVKSGGTFRLSLNTDIWYDNPTTPNQIALLEGGTVISYASAPTYPPFSVNQGTVVYPRSSSDQTVFDMDYHNLELKNTDSGSRKIWTLGADRVVTGELDNCYSAESVIQAGSARTLTIQGELQLTSGHLDISDPELTLEMADGARIRRLVGTIPEAPVFVGMVDMEYASLSTNVTTGPELPTATGVVNNFDLTGDQGVTLGADLTVNGVCSATGSDIFTDAYTLTLGPAASLVESDGMTVVGTVMTTRTVSQSVNETFGGIGIEVNAAGGAPGATEVTRVTGSSLAIDGAQGINRYFNIVPANNSGLDAAVVQHYDESELNGVQENVLAAYAYDGVQWERYTSSRDISVNTVTCSGVDELNTMTMANEGIVATLLQSFDCSLRDMSIRVSWKLLEAEGPERFTVYRENTAGGGFEPLDVDIASDDEMSYSFVDNDVEPESGYRYRVDVAGESGTVTLFLTEEKNTPAPKFELSQNFPNPFNPATTIRYSISDREHVVLDIFDVSGRRVARLVDGVQSAGYHTQKWTGQNAGGDQVSSGVYFYRLVTGKESMTRKMILLR